MTGVLIRSFRPGDEQGVIDVILPIQREEFGLAITAEDQPDLAAIEDFYQTGSGNFWVAEEAGRIVATVALKDIGDGDAALRKMFVAAPVRGREHGVATRLLETLLSHAREADLRRIFLGTTDKFLAAHRFYEKNGFSEIGRERLPPSFPVMTVDTKFYVLSL
jgi:N-acetylglutamate synthase-like GNAT family acetyltransferase